MILCLLLVSCVHDVSNREHISKSILNKDADILNQEQPIDIDYNKAISNTNRLVSVKTIELPKGIFQGTSISSKGVIKALVLTNKGQNNYLINVSENNYTDYWNRTSKWTLSERYDVDATKVLIRNSENNIEISSLLPLSRVKYKLKALIGKDNEDVLIITNYDEIITHNGVFQIISIK
jgi:hypothetical protein